LKVILYILSYFCVIGTYLFRFVFKCPSRVCVQVSESGMCSSFRVGYLFCIKMCDANYCILLC
jgi:hypothetical protein